VHFGSGAVSVLALQGRLGRSATASFERLTCGDRPGLVIVLAVQAALSLQLHNTAFEDEALYIYAGQQQIAHLLHGGVVYDTYSYLSGFPWFYPPIAGFLNNVGGLELARDFSLACLLATTLAAAAVARHLFGSRAALPSAVVFAIAGPVLFVGHLATYDALSLALIAGAAVVAVSPHRRRFLPAASIGGLLALAFLAKYVALVFAPSIAALAILCLPGSGWRLRPRLVTMVGIVTGAVALIAAVYGSLAVFAPQMSAAFIQGFVLTTLARGQLQVLTAPVTQILQSAALWQGPTLAIAIGGAFVALSRRRSIGLLLLATGLLPVAIQAYSHELTSLQKHVAFGIFFLSPLAGLAASAVIQAGSRLRTAGTNFVAAALVTVVLAGVGVRTAEALFSQWSDSSGIVDVLRTQARSGRGHYLAEESEVPRYYLSDVVSDWQWTGTFFFQYPTRSGQLLTGIDAYRAAIREGYFDIVALRYGPTADLDRQLYQVLRDTRLYTQIARVPVGPGHPDWFVWRRV
jgi:hypothetical protein